MNHVDIRVANENDFHFAQEISDIISCSAKIKEVGIPIYSKKYILDKMSNCNAIIALHNDKFIGFCCVEICDRKEYIAHSGLVVHPMYRNLGIAKKIKKMALDYSLKKYPNSKIFGITTNLAVMNINSDLGYKPVPFSELTRAPSFWSSCESCKYYDILIAKNHKMCLCTGLLFDPNERKNMQIQNAQKELVTT